MTEHDVINSKYSTRYLCSILEDMRKMHKTHNYSYMEGLIEELQYRANRMEKAIEDLNDIRYQESHRTELKAEIRVLRAEKKALEAEIEPKREKEVK